MRSTVASRKSRSCETHSSVPSNSASHSASHSRPSASRWLVGSSSRSTVGSPSSTDASRQRAASPPDSLPNRAPRSRCSMPESPERLVQPGFQRPAAERLEPLLRRAVGVQVGRDPVRARRARAGPPTPPPVLVARGRRWWSVGPGRPAAGSRRGRRHPPRPRRGQVQQRPPAGAGAWSCRCRSRRRARRARRRRASARGRRTERRDGEIGALEHGGPFGMRTGPAGARGRTRVEPTPRHRTSGPGFGTDGTIRCGGWLTSRSDPG